MFVSTAALLNTQWSHPPSTKVALLCRLIVIWVSWALRPGAELKTHDSWDTPLLAHQPTGLLDTNWWVLNSQRRLFSFTEVSCHFKLNPLHWWKLFSFYFLVLLLFLLLRAALFCHTSQLRVVPVSALCRITAGLLISKLLFRPPYFFFPFLRACNLTVWVKHLVGSNLFTYVLYMWAVRLQSQRIHCHYTHRSVRCLMLNTKVKTHLILLSN